MKKTTRLEDLRLGGLLAGLLLIAASPVLAETSYSYARVVEGSSTLFLEDGEQESLEAHQPVLVGDQVWVSQGSRLEVALADGSLLRIEGGSEVLFEEIAYSADTDGRRTVLQLLEGEAQWVVPLAALGGEAPLVVSPAATIYVRQAGTYRVKVDRDGSTELVVRDGMAELVNDRSSLRVYRGEAVWAEGGQGPRFEVRYAGNRDSLERWGDRLTEEAALAAAPYVEEPLRYASAPLASHGVWLEVGGRQAWRPRAEVAWRPYSRGYWRHTPVGYTWVSHDPWGWVTHHYGSWDYAAAHGWVWYPADVWAPARVVWYWGPDYVGWCPTGYYTHHYRRRHSRHAGGSFGLQFGLFGWAGGSWDHYSRWSFTASGHFGHRRHHRDVYSGRRMGQRHSTPGRGIITTDPGPARHPGRRPARDVYADLEARAASMKRENGRPLPDVTEFVARKPLRDEIARAVTRPWSGDEERKDLAVRSRDTGSSKSVPNAGTRATREAADRPGKEAVGERWTDRKEPWTEHKPRVAPRVDSKPRVAPRVDSKPRVAPRVDSKPRVAPRVDSKPRVAPRADHKPRVTPRADSKPRVAPRADSKPRVAPRADRPPRVAPRADSKPRVAPRANRPPRVAPRADSKPRVAPRANRPPRVAPRADHKPRVAPRVDRKPIPSRPQARPPVRERRPSGTVQKPAPARPPVRANPPPRRQAPKSSAPSARSSNDSKRQVRAAPPARAKRNESQASAKPKPRKPKDD